MRIMRCFIVGLVCANLLSCGFHFRGNINFPAELLPMELVDIRQRSQIKPVLASTFRAAGISVDNIAANSFLVLEEEKFNKVILSLSTAGESVTYNVNYEIRFHLRARNGDVIPSQSIAFSRPLEFEQKAVLSSVSEEKIIRQEMLTEASQQILRRLHYVRLTDFKAKAEPQNLSKPDGTE